MMKISYHGAKYNVTITDPETIELSQLQKIREDMIVHFEDFYFSGSGALIKLFDGNQEMKTIIVSPNLQFGIYLQFLENSGDPKNYKTYLSLYDSTKLDEPIETFDEIYASKGLFLPIDLAWSVISDFIVSGERSTKITWITPDEIPEEGNW